MILNPKHITKINTPNVTDNFNVMNNIGWIFQQEERIGAQLGPIVKPKIMLD